MGQSELGDPDEPMTIDVLSEDLARLLDVLGIERAPIVGWSMGGFIAQCLAVREPARVESLVLIGTDPGGPNAVRATPDDWARLIDHSGTPREQAARLIALLFPPTIAPAVDAAFGDVMAEAPRCVVDRTRSPRRSRRSRRWHEVEQHRPEPETAPPVLVLCGALDVVIPPQNGAAARGGLAGRRGGDL